MSDAPSREHAVDQLKQLGLREYEAKCFVALVELGQGTAREVSERVDVPRTRVYDAARMLEEQGLVEIQHSSPQEYRALSLDEAIEVLQSRFESRIDSLRTDLQALERDADDENASSREVWSLTDRTTIKTRTINLLSDADREAVLIVGDDRVLSEELLSALRAATDRGVSVVVGAASEPIRERLASALPDAEVFASELSWLRPPDEGPSVGRLLLVDSETLLASTIVEHVGETTEHAVFGNGIRNSLVVIARRLLSTGLERPLD